MGRWACVAVAVGSGTRLLTIRLVLDAMSQHAIFVV